MVMVNLQLKLIKGKRPQHITFMDIKKRKFQMKRERNTITNIGKHMSYGVGSYIYAGV